MKRLAVTLMFAALSANATVVGVWEGVTYDRDSELTGKGCSVEITPVIVDGEVTEDVDAKLVIVDGPELSETVLQPSFTGFNAPEPKYRISKERLQEKDAAELGFVIFVSPEDLTQVTKVNVFYGYKWWSGTSKYDYTCQNLKRVEGAE
jgi:hypothetical protein